MAHGMRDWTCVFFFGSDPKMCGKVDEKAVAACTEAKWIFPMLSLQCSLLLSCLAQQPDNRIYLRIDEPKGSLALIRCDTPRDLDHILIECPSHKLKVAEDESLLKIKTNGDNVRSVLARKPEHVWDCEVMLKEVFLVVC